MNSTTTNQIPNAIFVGSIPSNLSSEDLRSYFSQFGEIKSLKYKKKPGRLSNNVAILKVKTQRTFDLIFRSTPLVLNGTRLKIREMLKGKDLAEAEEEISLRRVYIKNIPFGVEDDVLTSLFKSFGEVELCYVCKDKRKPGASTDYAFVTFKDADSAEKAKKQGVLDSESLGFKLIIKGFNAKNKILKPQKSSKKASTDGIESMNKRKKHVERNENPREVLFRNFNLETRHNLRNFYLKEEGHNNQRLRRKSTFHLPDLDFEGIRTKKQFSKKENKRVNFNHSRGNIRFNHYSSAFLA